MSAKEVIKAMRTAVNEVKDQNDGMISAQALLKYFDTLDAQAEKESVLDAHEIEVNLATFRANHERDLAHEQAEQGNRREMARATISFGRDALRSATLINGGAAAALLAFIGNIWLKGIEPSASKVLTVSIAYFAFGVLAAASGTAASYLTQYCYFIQHRIAGAVHLVTALIVVAAFVLFGLGAYNSWRAFSEHFASTPPAAAQKPEPEN